MFCFKERRMLIYISPRDFNLICLIGEFFGTNCNTYYLLHVLINISILRITMLKNPSEWPF